MTWINLQSDKQLQNHQCCEQQAAECRQSPSNKVLCHKAWAKSCWMLWRSSSGPLHGMSIDNSPVSLSLCLSLSLTVSERVREWEHWISSIIRGLNDIPAHWVWLRPARPSSGSRGTQRSFGPSAQSHSLLSWREAAGRRLLSQTRMLPTAETLLHTCSTPFTGEQGGLSPLSLMKVTDYFTEQQHASLQWSLQAHIPLPQSLQSHCLMLRTTQVRTQNKLKMRWEGI